MDGRLIRFGRIVINGTAGRNWDARVQFPLSRHLDSGRPPFWPTSLADDPLYDPPAGIVIRIAGICVRVPLFRAHVPTYVLYMYIRDAPETMGFAKWRLNGDGERAESHGPLFSISPERACARQCCVGIQGESND